MLAGREMEGVSQEGREEAGGEGGEEKQEEQGVETVKPIVKRARKLLYRRLRVGVEDGRVFVGKFHCLDKQGNIILYDTLEFRKIPGPSASVMKEPPPMEQRSLGLVLIPARCRTSCCVECSLDEQLSLLSL